MSSTPSPIPPGAGRAEPEAVPIAIAELLGVVPELARQMATHLHEQVPELGGFEKDEVVEATRASCEANVREILVLWRAGIGGAAHQTPIEALDYARYMQHHGVPFSAVLAAYRHGVAMFEAVVGDELGHRVSADPRLDDVRADFSAFVRSYVERVGVRLAGEFGVDRSDWTRLAFETHGGEAEAEACRAAARTFREQWHAGGIEVEAGSTSAERALREFHDVLEEAASDAGASHRLALASTTVRVVMADEDDLAITLLLDRNPIEVLNGTAGHPEVELRIPSVDLARLWSPDFHLAMAIGLGRVDYRGPVRKFLLVMPVLRRLAAAARTA